MTIHNRKEMDRFCGSQSHERRAIRSSSDANRDLNRGAHYYVSTRSRIGMTCRWSRLELRRAMFLHSSVLGALLFHAMRGVLQRPVGR